MVIPPAALDAEQQLGRTAHLDGGVAGIPRMSGERQAVGACTDDGNVVIGGIHLRLHRRKCVKPACIAGLLPRQTLDGLHHGKGCKFRQDIGAGEQLFPLFILAQDRPTERMHDKHPLAGERRTPGIFVIVRLKRTELCEPGPGASADDLPLCAHVPKCQKVCTLRAGDIKPAETGKRLIVRGEYAGKIADFLPRFGAEIFAVIFQIFCHGAHLGRAAASE